MTHYITANTVDLLEQIVGISHKTSNNQIARFKNLMAYVKSMQILLTQFTTINAEIMSTSTHKTATIPVWGT